MNRKGKLLLCFTILILSKDLQTADASSALPTPVSPDCLACICKVESGCTIPDPVCRDDVGSLSCGPYQIKEAYWSDALLRGGELMGSWMECTAEFECSEQAVQGYMARYATSQRLERQPTCQDFARIHNGGPNGYKKDATSEYWETALRRYEECRRAADIFFPFGSSEADESLPANDDGSTAELRIAVVFPFFDQDHTSLFVNNNGVISFLSSVSQYTPNPFPLGRLLLTPFWADVDTRNGGSVFYREVLRLPENGGLFGEADNVIRATFDDMNDFVSSWMYIATWDSVAFFGASDTSIRNSFQAVLVTDGRFSFAIFNYGDINWTTGTASGGNSFTGLGGTPAQVGFNAGDGENYYSVSGSRTNSIVDIETTSNIGLPGRWVFRIDSEIRGQAGTSSGV